MQPTSAKLISINPKKIILTSFKVEMFLVSHTYLPRRSFLSTLTVWQEKGNERSTEESGIKIQDVERRP